MGIFSRKKKTQETIAGFKLFNQLKLPLIPFGDSIIGSDVVMICIDRIASQCAKLKARYIKEVSKYKEYKSFYNKCAAFVEQFCKEHKIKCHIKKGTKTDE